MSAGSSLVAQGGWPFLIAAGIGRLPAATVQLGMLMYVTAMGMGLELAGMTVAAIGLGTALGATLMGRLVDAFGPLPVVAGATLLQVLGLCTIHLMTPGLVDETVSGWAMLGVAAVVGFANPQVGPITRAHWSHIARSKGQPSLVSKALGYEGAMDEMSFIVGPIVASTLVALLGPTPALWTLVGLIVVGQGIFIVYLAATRSDWPTNAASGGTRVEARIPFGSLVAPMAVLLAVGITFGGTQTALTALNDARGTGHLTGIIYGSVGVGSAVASVLTPRLPARFTPPKRLIVGAVGLLLGGIGLYTLPTFWPSIVIAVAIGLAVGLILVTGFARAEAVAPTGRVASVMTVMAMCLTLGVSAGAASAGQLSGDLSHAFAPVLVAGLLAILASVLIAFSRRGGR